MPEASLRLIELAEYSIWVARPIRRADSGYACTHKGALRMNDRHGSLLLASSTARSSPLRTATLRSPLAPLWTATLLLAFASPALTQVSTPPASAKPQQATASQNETSPQEDDTTLPVRNPQKSTIAENLDSSWSMLTAAATDAKHTQHRVQALAATGTLGASPRAEKMLTTAMSDPDVDVRTAAVLAAGQSK